MLSVVKVIFYLVVVVPVNLKNQRKIIGSPYGL